MDRGTLEEKLVPVCRGKICSTLNLGLLRFLLCLFYIGLTIGLSGVVANYTIYSHFREHPVEFILVLLSFPVGMIAYWGGICWTIHLVEYVKSRR